MWDWPWSRFPQPEDYDPRLRARRRRIFWIVAGVVAVGLAGAWPAWRWWKDRLVATGVARAEASVERQEWRVAQLLLEQNLASHPNDPRVLRGMARFLDRLGQRDALFYWRALLEQKPASDADLIAAATAGLRLGDRALAREALAAASANAKSGADWLRPAAGLELVEGRWARAREYLGVLHRLDPKDVRAEVNFQVARLDDGSATEREDARARLAGLARHSALRIGPTLALLASGQRADAPESFGQVARRIFPGRRLEEEDAMFALIEHMKQQPSPNEEDAVRLVRYLAERARAREARLWLAELEPAVRALPPVREAEAGLNADLADWPALRVLLEKGAWGGAATNALAAGFAAREHFARGDEAAAMAQWRLALAASETDARGAALLVRLAVLWGQPEAARLALRMTRAPARVLPDTLARLVRLAAEQGNTRALWQAVERWAAAEPSKTELADRSLYLAAVLDELTAPQRAGLAGAPSTSEFRWSAQSWVALNGAGDRARWEALVAQPVVAAAPASVRLLRGLLLRRLGRNAEAGGWLDGLARGELLPEERERWDEARPKGR